MPSEFRLAEDAALPYYVLLTGVPVCCSSTVSFLSSKGRLGSLRAVCKGSAGEGVRAHLSHHAPAVAKSHQRLAGGQGLRKTALCHKLLAAVCVKPGGCLDHVGALYAHYIMPPLLFMTAAAVFNSFFFLQFGLTNVTVLWREKLFSV